MKKYLFIFLVLIAPLIANNDLFAQDRSDDEEQIDAIEYTEEEYQGNDIFKSIFIDAGYGTNKFGFGLGFRYWNLGFSFGLAGLGESIPHYFTYREGGNITPATAVDIEKYSSIHVTTDLYYFHDINDEFKVFGNIGYGVGTDSVLAHHKDDQGTSNKNRLYSIGTETNSGITFGLGVQYFLEEWIGFGIGYHNRRGVYAQFNYFWF